MSPGPQWICLSSRGSVCVWLPLCTVPNTGASSRSSAMDLGDASKLQSPYPTECFLCPSGSLSRAGPLPLLRQPPIMQPPMDLKQILPFPLEPAPTLGLFSNYSTVSTVRLPLPCPLAPSLPLHFSPRPNSSSLPVSLIPHV